jgi:hypothetical protein
LAPKFHGAVRTTLLFASVITKFGFQNKILRSLSRWLPYMKTYEVAQHCSLKTPPVKAEQNHGHFSLSIAFGPTRTVNSNHSAGCLPSNALSGQYPMAMIRPNEGGGVYNFAQSGRLSGNPGYLKSEAIAHLRPSEKIHEMLIPALGEVIEQIQTIRFVPTALPITQLEKLDLGDLAAENEIKAVPRQNSV